MGQGESQDLYSNIRQQQVYYIGGQGKRRDHQISHTRVGAKSENKRTKGSNPFIRTGIGIFIFGLI